MATWPTSADIQAAWSKLNQPALVPKIDRSRAQAINEIKAAMASRYDVSPWTDLGTVTPPALVDLAYQLAYGHANRSTHTGDRATPSDQTGEKSLDDAREILKSYYDGDRDLVDDAGNLVPQRDSPTGMLIATQLPTDLDDLFRRQTCGCGSNGGSFV